MQWIIVILIGIATAAYIAFKILKTDKNNPCRNCDIYNNCALKEMKRSCKSANRKL